MGIFELGRTTEASRILWFLLRTHKISAEHGCGNLGLLAGPQGKMFRAEKAPLGLLGYHIIQAAAIVSTREVSETLTRRPQDEAKPSSLG